MSKIFLSASCWVAHVVNDTVCKECKVFTSSDFSFLFSSMKDCIVPISYCNRVLVFSGAFNERVSATFCEECTTFALGSFALLLFPPLLRYICPLVRFCLEKEGVCLWWRNPRQADRQVLEASIRYAKAVNCAPWPILSG